MISYLTGITAACGLLFLDTFLRANEKKHRVIVNMNDYLENVLENTISGKEAVEDPATQRAHNRPSSPLCRREQEEEKDGSSRLPGGGAAAGGCAAGIFRVSGARLCACLR